VLDRKDGDPVEPASFAYRSNVDLRMTVPVAADVSSSSADGKQHRTLYA
jgi:hypothetical protein